MLSAPTASSIEVTVRVRPLRGELQESDVAWRVDATSLAELAQPDNTFTFDRVYDTKATTTEIYKHHVRESIVTHVVQGYNGTVFAYGQTGSGKTYTMFGDPSSNRAPGLIRLAVHDLFKALAVERQQKPYVHTEVFVSVLEIYNEQLRDLLRDDDGPTSAPAPPLSIRENEHGVYVHNAIRAQVATELECVTSIYTHAASRVSAATKMNERSSRSHCVIRVLVERSYYLEDATSALDEEEGDEQEEDDDATTTATNGEDADENCEDEQASSTYTGQNSSQSGGRQHRRPRASTGAKHRRKIISTLNMVDLAGSERVAKTGATGLRMIEGGHINKSLTTLTTVINRLASEAAVQGSSGAFPIRRGPNGSAATGATSFIPYRDSRLTHLLKTAIGGNSFTAVLCCVTPAIESANESRSTLQFASRAKKIKNKVRVNEVVNPQTRVRELEAALRHTKKLLIAQTLYLWSTRLKVRKYEAQLSSGGGGASSYAATTAASLIQGTDATGAATRLTQQQQQAMIIAQLNAQKDALQEELTDVKVQLEKTLLRMEDAPGAAAGSSSDANLASVQRALESAQGMLKEREAALRAAQDSVDELDGLCRELESESKSQAAQIRTLKSGNSEAEELMSAVEEEHAALQQELSLLRTQLRQSQTKLLEKHRGDDYLSELTKLHVEHQNLQVSCNQLKEKADRDKTELMQRLQHMTEQSNTLEDDLDEAKEEAQVRNAYLWRLLSAAAHVTHDTPLTVKDLSAVVRESQVVEAVRSLTSFATLSTTSKSGTDGVVGAGESTRQLQGRIRALEEQLIAKDAQRDVIIDTKLKRIQGLVLRLHTVNVALVNEMRCCFRDNELLYEIAMKTSKTQKKVDKLGLTQRSLESALDRARFSPPPHKPLFHN